MPRLSEQRTLEYWCAREPFLSSHRAIAHVESISVIPRAPFASLLIRGWLFEKRLAISTLKISCQGGGPDVSVHGIERLDVSKNFPSFRHSRLSGFMSILALTAPTPDTIRLQGSYLCEDGQINIVFETATVSHGIACPGRIISSPAHPQTGDNRWLALLIVPGSSPSLETLTQIVQHASKIDAAVHIFGDLATNTLSPHGIPLTAHSYQRHELDELTSILCLSKSPIAEVFVVGAPDRVTFCNYLAPALVLSPCLKVSWVTPAKYFAEHKLLPELRGNFIKFYDGEFMATRQRS